MSDSVQYQFGLKIGNKEIHLGGDKVFVETQMEKWLQLFQQELPSELQGDTENAGSEPQGKLAPPQRALPTLPEFIKTKGPKEITDMILVIGLYLERFKQMNLFSRTDLLETQIFERLGKSETDVQQALNRLVGLNMLSESAPMGSKEMSYSISFTGEQALKDGF